MDGLEDELGNRIEIVRLNAQDDVGRALSRVYLLEFTPTFVFFAPGGHELWRSVGQIDPQLVRDSIGQPER